ncbi:MAG TPA: hypothetical protein VFW25_01130 [Silvibacterium sp.]|nr:hypothetical protein [Silvibacterium sp.]
MIRLAAMNVISLCLARQKENAQLAAALLRGILPSIFSLANWGNSTALSIVSVLLRLRLSGA